MVLVKNAVMSALKLAGREEIADALMHGYIMTDEQTEAVSTMLYCFNAVEDELARKYIPLTKRDEVLAFDGKFAYTALAYTPVRIKRVMVNGVDVEYELFAQYLTADARKVVIEYEYTPDKKTIEGMSEFTSGVSEYMLALGAAAEYCFINGEVEAAGIWEAKYRREIDSAQKKLPCGGIIPPRRWV